ncbi:MAG: DUF1801 domain-containing protein [Acidobacteriota bacterium]
MAKAKNKTTETENSVEGFLNSIDDEQKRLDAVRLVEIFEKVTREKPKMWGPSIIGFGNRLIKYESGRELDWLVTGFSPRKSSLTLYVANSSEEQKDALAKLGSHKVSGGCLHIKRLSDVDEKVLEKVIKDSVNNVRMPSNL